MGRFMKLFISEADGDETFSPTEIAEKDAEKEVSEKDETEGEGEGEVDRPKEAESKPESDEKDEEKPKEDDKNKQEDESIVAKSKARKKKIRAIRDQFIEDFNAENEGKTRLKILAYEPYTDFIKSIKVTYEIDPEEIYLDKDKYSDGNAWLELNDVFFKDINAVAVKNGIKRIEWKRDDDSRFGNLILSDRLEESL